ncbi:MAG: flavodoxin domain-containing protein [Propioniciclava sp.]
MGSVLVAYATRTRAARDVAAALADTFTRAGHRVRLADLGHSDPGVEDTDLVVVGSGIRATVWYPEAMAWLDAHAEALGGCPVAVFNTCLNAADPTKRDESLGYNRGAAALVPVHAQETFTGRYVRDQVGWAQGFLLRLLRQREQDHVDVARARAWGATLTALMQQRQA